MNNSNEIWCREYAKIIINSVADGVFTIDPGGKIMSWNKSMEKITGYKKEEAIGKECTFIHFSSCLGSSCPTGINDCGILDSDKDFSRECIIMSKTGEEIPVLKRAKPIRNENKDLKLIVETVTDLRKIKEARQSAINAQNMLAMENRLENIIGISPVMEDIFAKIKMAAQSDANILISGESGTGKELTAKAIHYLSQRTNEPIIPIHCSALPENLLESELFGHVKGSFTGAFKDKKGKFEMAHNGTLFLDEVGEIPLSMQVKLLRALQEREIERVGDVKKIKINIRIISATNKDLMNEIKNKNFREDLYYRLKVFPIHMPALRQRREDILLLINFFMEKLKKSTGKNISGIDKNAVNILKNYSWPGNVRELENAVSHAFVVSNGPVLNINDFPDEIISQKNKAPRIKEIKKPKTKDELINILDECGWNKAEAARHMGVSRTSVWKYMKKWDIPMNK